MNSEINGDTGTTGNQKPPTSNKDTNVSTSLLLEKLHGKNTEIGKLQNEINNLKEESEKYEEIQKAIEEKQRVH